jgi:hypothetical protein
MDGWMKLLGEEERSGYNAYNVRWDCIGVWRGCKVYHWWMKDNVGCIEISFVCGRGGDCVNEGYHEERWLGRNVLYVGYCGRGDGES